MPIFTDMAPNWAKAMATVAAARNGKNIEAPFGFVVDKEKAPWTGRVGGRSKGVTFGLSRLGVSYGDD